MRGGGKELVDSKEKLFGGSESRFYGRCLHINNRHVLCMPHNNADITGYSWEPSENNYLKCAGN